MNIFEGCTHFARGRTEGSFICFPLETCEKCGATIYNDARATANIHSVTVPGVGELCGRSLETYFSNVMGLVYLDKTPPNLVVDFDEDEWGCDNCM